MEPRPHILQSFICEYFYYCSVPLLKIKFDTNRKRLSLLNVTKQRHSTKLLNNVIVQRKCLRRTNQNTQVRKSRSANKVNDSQIFLEILANVDLEQQRTAKSQWCNNGCYLKLRFYQANSSDCFCCTVVLYFYYLKDFNEFKFFY